MSEAHPKTAQAFETMFATEAACRAYVEALRWPDGFVCPGCGAKAGMRMRHGVWLCSSCRRQTSTTAGTVFQDSHLPLTTWFRAMWHLTSQKNGISALGLQRVLGLGSYRTAWSLLHKLRRAMVRPDREKLSGRVEVDETYWGGPEPGLSGRQTNDKALILIAVETKQDAMGRIRMRRVPKAGRDHLHRFIGDVIEPGSTVATDGWLHYRNLSGYTHEVHVQEKDGRQIEKPMPNVHRVVALLKRWLLGTHQAAVEHDYLDSYLDEFTFRFNRRTSASRGRLFWRLAQQCVQVEPATLQHIKNHKPWGRAE